MGGTARDAQSTGNRASSITTEPREIPPQNITDASGFTSSPQTKVANPKD